MGCGLVAVIRQDQRHHLLFAALVYGVCQFPAQVTAEPPPVMTTSVVSELGDAAARCWRTTGSCKPCGRCFIRAAPQKPIS